MKLLPDNNTIDQKLFKVFNGSIIRIQNCDIKYKHGFIKVKCTTCNNEWTPRFDYLIKNGCKFCNGAVLIPEIFDKRIKDIFGESYVRKSDIKLGLDVNKTVLMHCKICNSDNLQRTYHVLSGHGCKVCGKKLSEEKQRLTVDEIIKRSKEINGDKYDYSKIGKPKNERDKILLICKIHGEFYQTVSDHLYNKSGCPKCRESKGEKSIRLFLENNKIQYHKHKSFDSCKYKNKLYFDFYLPKYNILIEYDGEQHYSGWRYNTKTNTLNSDIKKSKEIIKIRDEIKDKWCKDNNIKLIRISYKHFKNIKKILKFNLLL
jgi:very-short-patch-repair endonuclease